MRKGDSHLELLIYLASILQRQSPGGVPCQGRHRAPWPAILPRFWPWQRSPLCSLTHDLPGYYRVCDLSMCESLTRPSTTLSLGRCWNTPVYPLIVCPSVGREGVEGTLGRGKHGNQETRLGSWEPAWKPKNGGDRKPLSDSGSLSGAFDVKHTTFAFLSLTSCLLNCSLPNTQGHHHKHTQPLRCTFPLWSPTNQFYVPERVLIIFFSFDSCWNWSQRSALVQSKAAHSHYITMCTSVTVRHWLT